MGRNLGSAFRQELANLDKDPDTNKTAMSNLRTIVKDLDAKALHVFLNQLSETKEIGSDSGGGYTVSLFEDLARAHGVKISPHVETIMPVIVRTLSSCEGALSVQQACSKAVAAIARYGIDPATAEDKKRNVLHSLCKPLSDSLLDSQHLALGASCNIPVPQSELDQSKARLIRRDRHVGHVILIVLVRNVYGAEHELISQGKWLERLLSSYRNSYKTVPGGREVTAQTPFNGNPADHRRGRSFHTVFGREIPREGGIRSRETEIAVKGPVGSGSGSARTEQWYALGLLVRTAVRSKPHTEKRISRRFVMYTRVCTVVTIRESVHKPREWDDRLGLYDGSRVPGARMVLTGFDGSTRRGRLRSIHMRLGSNAGQSDRVRLRRRSTYWREQAMDCPVGSGRTTSSTGSVREREYVSGYDGYPVGPCCEWMWNVILAVRARIES
uniref:TORTIFOLIA1/SINE1-2 N-terminal domain-containing protein n=1 Tax=Brassica oleracea var. oleracea TaxID=109376 RepID=A0A0D3AFR3_BRAOL